MLVFSSHAKPCLVQRSLQAAISWGARDRLFYSQYRVAESCSGISEYEEASSLVMSKNDVVVTPGCDFMVLHGVVCIMCSCRHLDPWKFLSLRSKTKHPVCPDSALLKRQHAPH